MAKYKLVPIKNGRGEIKGHIRMYYSESLKRYVSIPKRHKKAEERKRRNSFKQAMRKYEVIK